MAENSYLIAEQSLQGFSLDEETNLYFAPCTLLGAPVFGDVYNVKWEDEEYTCTAYTAEGMLCLGNISLVMPGFSDTGEPFIAIFTDSDGATFATSQEGSAHTIAVYRYGVEQDSTILVNNQLFLFELDTYYNLYGWSYDTFFQLTEGSTYEVTWDSAKYVCNAKQVSLGSISGLALGNLSIAGVGEDTGEPFILAYLPNYALNAGYSTDTALATHVISVSEQVLKGASIYLYDKEGVKTLYENADKVSFLTADGTRQVYTCGQLYEQTPEFDVNFSNGNSTISAENGYVIRKASIKKPLSLLPENILKDIDIAGVTGQFEVLDVVEVSLDMSNGNQEAVAYDGLQAVKKVIIVRPDTFIPDNIAEGVEIAGVVGTFKGGNGVHKDIEPNFSEGDYTVIPEDENTLFESVTIIKPANLVSQNILNGVDIAGVVGDFTAPKLNAPTFAVTSGTLYNTVKVTNPSTNGSFAKTLNVYVNGELATTQDAPASGGSASIVDVSIFDEDGEHTFSAELVGEGFVTSDKAECATKPVLYSVNITPESVADNYDYPAVKSGATLDLDINEKAASHFLPPDITVLMNGVPCAYTWKEDDGISVQEGSSTAAFCTHCKTGQLTIANITGRLDIDIPVTDLPQLRKPTITKINGDIYAVPPDFAEALHIFIDGEEYAIKQGVTYTKTGSNFTKDMGMGGAGVALGAYTLWVNNTTSGDYVKDKITFNVPEETIVKIRCVLYTSGLSTSNYLVFSKLDTELSTTTTDTSTNIHATIKSSNAIQYVTYTIPAGEHYIWIKWREGVTADVGAYPGFVPQVLCNRASVILPDYAPHTVSAYASAAEAIDSVPVETIIQMHPTCFVDDAFTLTATGIASAVNQIEVYANDTLVCTVPYDGTDISVNMNDYTSVVGKSSVYIRVLGDGIDEVSDTIVAYTNYQPIYGVSGLYQSDPALTRTDDAVGLTYTINTDGTVQSDFDSLFPWTEAKLVSDSLSNKFVQMPEMWFRVNNDASYRLTDIAVSATKGPGDNWYKVEPFCIGRYTTNKNSTTKLVSKAGITHSAGATRANLRSYANANGSNYHIKDLYGSTIMKFLWWIEWATKDAASIMTGCYKGSGTTGGNAKTATGVTDSLTTPSGYVKARNNMRWHYIEDFIGGYSEILDGVYVSALSVASYATADTTKYADATTGMKQLAYKNPAAGYCIMAYGWDPNNPFLCLPCESTTTGVYTEYFCTRGYDYGSGKFVCMETPNYNYTGGNSGGAYAGFMFRAVNNTNGYVNYATRLMYRGSLG